MNKTIKEYLETVKLAKELEAKLDSMKPEIIEYMKNSEQKVVSDKLGSITFIESTVTNIVDNAAAIELLKKFNHKIPMKESVVKDSLRINLAK